MGYDTQQKALRIKVGHCEACNFDIKYALHVHHCTPEKIRGSRYIKGTEVIVLCANCHYMLHHEIGFNFGIEKILTKKQSLELIEQIYQRESK